MFIKHLLVITEQGTKKSLSNSQKIFSHINYFKSLPGVCGGGGRDMQPSFCRRRHFGGSWYWVGSGNPVMRGLDFILFFFSYFVFSPAKQLVGSSCHFLEVPSEGWEMNLSFCHCKQRTGDSLSSKGLGTLLVGQRKRPQSRVGRRRVPTCPRAHTGAKGQSACL